MILIGISGVRSESFVGRDELDGRRGGGGGDIVVCGRGSGGAGVVGTLLGVEAVGFAVAAAGGVLVVGRGGAVAGPVAGSVRWLDWRRGRGRSVGGNGLRDDADAAVTLVL